MLVDGEEVGRIDLGLTVLLGIGKGDSKKDTDKLVDKILNLRIFEDEKGKFNYSVLDVKGSVLVVSQFTLYANLRKGRRPSFEEAEDPEKARELYNYFVEVMSKSVPVSTGKFGASMELYIINLGPATFLLDSKEL